LCILANNSVIAVDVKGKVILAIDKLIFSITCSGKPIKMDSCLTEHFEPIVGAVATISQKKIGESWLCFRKKVVSLHT
jgi:hypothetical protein